MKHLYQVLVEEKYSKYVTVFADEEADLHEAVAAMMDAGEIEFSDSDDSDGWNIASVLEMSTPVEMKSDAAVWANGAVAMMAAADPIPVITMTRENAMEALERMRDNGAYIPEYINSEELYDAVCRLREKKGWYANGL